MKFHFCLILITLLISQSYATSPLKLIKEREYKIKMQGDACIIPTNCTPGTEGWDKWNTFELDNLIRNNLFGDYGVADSDFNELRKRSLIFSSDPRANSSQRWGIFPNYDMIIMNGLSQARGESSSVARNGSALIHFYDGQYFVDRKTGKRNRFQIPSDRTCGIYNSGTGEIGCIKRTPLYDIMYLLNHKGEEIFNYKFSKTSNTCLWNRGRDKKIYYSCPTSSAEIYTVLDISTAKVKVSGPYENIIDHSRYSALVDGLFISYHGGKYKLIDTTQGNPATIKVLPDELFSKKKSQLKHLFKKSYVFSKTVDETDYYYFLRKSDNKIFRRNFPTDSLQMYSDSFAIIVYKEEREVYKLIFDEEYNIKEKIKLGDGIKKYPHNAKGFFAIDYKYGMVYDLYRISDPITGKLEKYKYLKGDEYIKNILNNYLVIINKNGKSLLKRFDSEDVLLVADKIKIEYQRNETQETKSIEAIQINRKTPEKCLWQLYDPNGDFKTPLLTQQMLTKNATSDSFLALRGPLGLDRSINFGFLIRNYIGRVFWFFPTVRP